LAQLAKIGSWIGYPTKTTTFRGYHALLEGAIPCKT
jgi:hypothetical protein